MPFLYKTAVKQSTIHGKGIFTLENIPKGAVYWMFEHQTGGIPVEGCENLPNLFYTQETIKAITDEKQLRRILHGGFLHSQANVYIHLRDGDHFMNHSDSCNGEVCYDPQGDFRKVSSIALRDISAGEEITEDYGNYLSEKRQWADELMKKYLPERSRVENQHGKSSSNKENIK